MNTMMKLIVLLFFISVAFGEFQLQKRTRDYTEAPDHITLKIKKTSCKEFLKNGGLSERIKGGYSHHCLPIGLKGEDVDDLKFIGRCMDDDKDIIVTIVQIYSKNKKIEIKTDKYEKEDDENDYEKKDKMMKRRTRSLVNTDDVEFYLRLKAKDEDIEYKIMHFGLKNGHAYQVRRPSCLKARNHCETSKYRKDGMLVIDCIQRQEVKGKVKKGREVYIEVTRRDERPDTCRDAKNGSCCRYVSANDNQGICKVYWPKGGRKDSNKGGSSKGSNKESNKESNKGSNKESNKGLGKNKGGSKKPKDDGDDAPVMFEVKSSEDIKQMVNDAKSAHNKNIINNKNVVENKSPQPIDSQVKSSSDDSNKTTISIVDSKSSESTPTPAPEQDEFIEMDLMVEDDGTPSKRSSSTTSSSKNASLASNKTDASKKSDSPVEVEFDPFDEDIEFEVEDAKKNVVPNVSVVSKKENVQPTNQIKQ